MMLHTSLIIAIISIIFVVVVENDENSAKCDALSWM